MGCLDVKRLIYKDVIAMSDMDAKAQRLLDVLEKDCADMEALINAFENEGNYSAGTGLREIHQQMKDIVSQVDVWFAMYVR